MAEKRVTPPNSELDIFTPLTLGEPRVLWMADLFDWPDDDEDEPLAPSTGETE